MEIYIFFVSQCVHRKKVEVFHSLLRAQCPSWSCPEQITQFAEVLSARKFDSAFASNFLIPTVKGKSRQNLSYLAARTAEYFTKQLKRISEKSRGLTKVMVGKAKRRVIDLPTFNCTLDQRALPLGFSVQKMPDEDLICDFQGCDEVGGETIVLTCGHSFHLRCINSNSCVYCQPFLLKDLSQKFNATLLTSEMEEEREEPSGTNENDDEDDFESGFDDYYSSHEFVNHLMIELDGISMAGVS